MAIQKRKGAESLAAWLHAHGKTQLWLADQLGVSLATMSRIVRGHCMPRAALALDIEKRTGVSVVAMTRARASITPRNKTARRQYGQSLIDRGTAIIAAVDREQ